MRHGAEGLSIKIWIISKRVGVILRIQGFKACLPQARIRGFKWNAEELQKVECLAKLYGLCLEIYRITAKFPKDERYGLTSKIRRSAVPIASNIAGGYGRKTTVDYIWMLHISYGSICELETQILLAGVLSFIEQG